MKSPCSCGEKEKPMRMPLLIATAVSGALIASAAFAADGDLPARKRYLPEYTESGDLKLPKNFNEWVYVGSPLTPNGLNGGKANFPEFHNVYIEPGSYEIYKKMGEFPEGTIFFKELQLALPGDQPNGSRSETPLRSDFSGKLNGDDVTFQASNRISA